MTMDNRDISKWFLSNIDELYSYDTKTKANLVGGKVSKETLEALENFFAADSISVNCNGKLVIKMKSDDD